MTETNEYLKLLYGACAQLVVEGTTRGSSVTAAFILLLREKAGKRLFPALLSEEEYGVMVTALRKEKYPTVRLAARMADAMGLTLYGVRLQYPDKGRYEAFLDYMHGNRHVMMKCSLVEAVCMALQEGRPIVTRTLNLGSASRFSDGDTQQVSFPLSAMSRELLEEALRASVESDNFEQASFIRDELKRRGATS